MCLGFMNFRAPPAALKQKNALYVSLAVIMSRWQKSYTLRVTSILLAARFVFYIIIYNDSTF